MIYKTGDTPGKGAYKCTLCGFVIYLCSDDEALPACFACMHNEFEQIA